MDRAIELNTVTKVEGHAKLLLNIDEQNNIKKCELESIEGSRYFEGMLKGRQYFEAPEITSRICGICSCAHVASSIKAVEKALGIEVSLQTKTLREIFTVGERIRSHITHMYFLSLPDYLGVESGMDLAITHKEEVLRALRLMKLGNDIITMFTGRDLHPVSPTIGGFLHLPSQEQIDNVVKRLKDSLPDALAAARLFIGLKYPKFEMKGQFCSLVAEGDYPIMGGSINCSIDDSGGHTFSEERFNEFFKEYHEERSTANFVVKDGKSYAVGALSRLNNNYEYLQPQAKMLLEEAKIKSKLKLPSHNPFYITLAQAIETVHFIEKAISTLENFKVVDEEPTAIKVKAGSGIGIIEVPRGMLMHEYDIDENGFITRANIVTPTAQNLRMIEDSIRAFLPQVLKLKNEEIVKEVEKLIRSYDPCFSCSTHFLDVTFVGPRADK